MRQFCLQKIAPPRDLPSGIYLPSSFFPLPSVRLITLYARLRVLHFAGDTNFWDWDLCGASFSPGDRLPGPPTSAGFPCSATWRSGAGPTRSLTISVKRKRLSVITLQRRPYLPGGAGLFKALYDGSHMTCTPDVHSVIAELKFSSEVLLMQLSTSFYLSLSMVFDGAHHA